MVNAVVLAGLVPLSALLAPPVPSKTTGTSNASKRIESAGEIGSLADFPVHPLIHRFFIFYPLFISSHMCRLSYSFVVFFAIICCFSDIKILMNTSVFRDPFECTKRNMSTFERRGFTKHTVGAVCQSQLYCTLSLMGGNSGALASQFTSRALGLNVFESIFSVAPQFPSDAKRGLTINVPHDIKRNQRNRSSVAAKGINPSSNLRILPLSYPTLPRGFDVR